MLGYTEQEALAGQVHPGVLHDPEEVKAEAERLSQEYGVQIQPGFEVFTYLPYYYGQVYRREWTYTAKDGTRFPVLLAVSPLRDAEGHITGYTGLAQDISDRKQYEAEIQEQNEELQSREEELRQNLEQLQQTQQQMEETQQELEEREANLRMIFENAPLGLIITELEQGTILMANDKICEITGFAREELIGYQTPDFYYKPEDRDYVRQQLAEQGGLKNFEVQLKQKGGAPIWTDFNLSLITYQGKRCIFGTVADVEERKRRERELSKQLSILESSSDFIAIGKLGGGHELINKAGRELIGLPQDKPAEAIYIEDIVTDEMLHMFSEEIFPAVYEQGFWQGITSLLHQETGEEIPTETMLFPIYEPGTQEIISLGTIQRDIRARQDRERTLELQKQILLNAPEPIALTEKGIITECNEAYLQVLGAERREQVVGQSPEVISPEQQPDGTPSGEGAMQHIQQAIEQGFHQFEWVHQRMDGTPFDAEVLLRCVTYNGRQLLISSIRDITERKQRERNLALQQQLFENAPNPIGVLENGHFLSCNQAYAESFGFPSPDSLIGRNPGEFSPAQQPDGADSGEKALAKMQEAQEQGEAYFTWRHYKQDGTPFDAEVTLRPLLFQGRALLQSTLREISVADRSDQAPAANSKASNGQPKRGT
jgi:PAS domain S-box-containing protein